MIEDKGYIGMNLFTPVCSGFSGNFVWSSPHEWIISVATSFRLALDERLQNSTALLFSVLADSWATEIATVVFPNPGPPMIKATGIVPSSMISMTCCVSWDRPNSSSYGSLSGKQLWISDFASFEPPLFDFLFQMLLSFAIDGVGFQGFDFLPQYTSFKCHNS